MQKITLLILTLMLFSSCQSSQTTDSHKDSSKWINLFNGENLEGWTIRIAGKKMNENFGSTFRVEDGLLKIRYDAYESFDQQFGAIFYDQSFANYRLKMEYRFVGETAPGAPEWGFRDSGVQFHGQSPQSMQPDQPFPVCLEYNLHGGNGADERPTGAICAIGTVIQISGARNSSFCTAPEVQRTFHGDQWVSLEIDVQDSLITHYVNGEKILNYSDPRYDAEHDFGKLMIRNGNDRVTSGYISLQSNSHPIDFRKIELLEY